MDDRRKSGASGAGRGAHDAGSHGIRCRGFLRASCFAALRELEIQSLRDSIMGGDLWEKRFYSGKRTGGFCC